MTDISDYSTRPKTGPLKLGNDWTGYFFRGDDALGVATALKLLAASIEHGDPKVCVTYIRQLAEELETVRE